MRRMHVKAMLIALLAGVSLLFSCGKSNTEPTQPKDVAVTSVTLNQVSIELKVGESVQLTATVQPSNATSKTITWSTSNSSVASIANGLLTAIGEGSATITASAGGKSANCTVTVKQNVIAVTSITLDQTSVELTEGDNVTITATVKPDNATNKTVTWSSSAPEVASIQDGKITAIKAGDAVIKAVAGDKSATCNVKVKAKVIAVESIELNKSEITLKEGDSETLEATVKPDNATDKTVTWSTSVSDVATVNNVGKVKAVSIGETIITASCGGVSAKCTVKVKDPIDFSIVFNDALVKNALLPYADKDNDSEISYREAAQIEAEDLKSALSSSRAYTSFQEFEFFTTITSIPAGLFKDCDKLKSIKLPETVTSIGEYAFYDCRSLRDFIFPQSLKTIGKYAFWRSLGLSSITIPDGVTISDYAFFVSGAKQVKFGNNVIIGESAFTGCSSLASLAFSEYTTISMFAFMKCEALINVELKKLSSIPKYLFAHNSNLKSVVIHETSSIDIYWLNECFSIEKITFLQTTPPATPGGGNTFPSLSDYHYHIYVPKESLETYQEKWSSLKDVLMAIEE